MEPRTAGGMGAAIADDDAERAKFWAFFHWFSGETKQQTETLKSINTKLSPNAANMPTAAGQAVAFETGGAGGGFRLPGGAGGGAGGGSGVGLGGSGAFLAGRFGKGGPGAPAGIRARGGGAAVPSGHTPAAGRRSPMARSRLTSKPPMTRRSRKGWTQRAPRRWSPTCQASHWPTQPTFTPIRAVAILTRKRMASPPGTMSVRGASPSNSARCRTR